MSPWLHFVPVAVAALGWLGLTLINRRTGWFRTGEVIFWDAVLLVVIFLVWLQWF